MNGNFFNFALIFLNIILTFHVWYKTGFPQIYGWVFDVRTGKLIDLGLKMEEEFASIRNIYVLKPLDK